MNRPIIFVTRIITMNIFVLDKLCIANGAYQPEWIKFCVRL